MNESVMNGADSLSQVPSRRRQGAVVVATSYPSRSLIRPATGNRKMAVVRANEQIHLGLNHEIDRTHQRFVVRSTAITLWESCDTLEAMASL